MSGGGRRGGGGGLALDAVVGTQPGLGPAAPDGGYGWLVFAASLYFQALVPSLIVSYGILLAFESLSYRSENNDNPQIWDNKFLYVPLTFIASWTFFDPRNRQLIASSTWPRLVATAATCLICAGLLFLWMGITGYGYPTPLYLLSGLISGIGASLQMAQCEILLSQYFRYKLTVVTHTSHTISAMGFIIVPIVLGHHILNSSTIRVVLWYQAIILQGLAFNLTFKKPQYLKSNQPTTYNYMSASVEDEEDIFSKNSRELQITRQNSDGTANKIEKHEIPQNSLDQPGTSGSHNSKQTQNWIKFDEDKDIKQEWETFEDDSGVSSETNPTQHIKHNNWETFDDESQTAAKPKNLQLELSFAEDHVNEEPSTTVIAGMPLPLFSDLPVNNNNTYSYEELEDQTPVPHQHVFMPTTVSGKPLFSALDLLRQPTFYKSLLIVITTKYSIFVFFSLYPRFLYQELPHIQMRAVATLVGIVSLSSLLFGVISYWVNIDRKRKPIYLWILCWVGGFGYYMISDYSNEYVLLFGGIQVVLSIASLQHVACPSMGLTIRGEPTSEYFLISTLAGVSFLFFYIIDASYKDCFRLMALMHLLNGGIWLGNVLYKKFIFR